MAHYIGKRLARVGAVESARGKSLFSADIPLDRPLVLKVFRSSRHHAKITYLDVGKASQVEGVVGVLTSGDIPGESLFGLIVKDQPLLARDKVRFMGEPVALVAAEDEESAEEAVKAIEIDYSDLPAVLLPQEALKHGAPLLHEKGNLLYRRPIVKGDAQKALSESYVVVKRTYTTSRLEHSYLEPDAGAGYVDDDGTLVIYASTQNPHYDHKEVCRLLGLPEERIRIIQAATGGGFGSKLDLTVQGLIGLALYHFARPVRLVFSREEVCLGTPKRHPFWMEYETGADANGRLTAVRARLVCDTGAYASYGMAVAIRAAVHAVGPYQVDNVDVECSCVYTNNPVSGAMRGFGVPQAACAHEAQINLIAERLGISPVDIRRINALRPGSLTGTRQQLSQSVGFLKTLDAIDPYYLEALSSWKSEASVENVKRGVGVGSMWYGIGNTGAKNPSTARVEMDSQGRITLYTGAADIGQGSSTVLRQIAAEVLSVNPDRIALVVADTSRTTSAGATSASRQTYISGNAVKDAAEKLADFLLNEAGEAMGTSRDSLRLEGGSAVAEEDVSQKISIAELSERAHEKGEALVFEGFFDPLTTPLDPDTGEGVPYATYAFATHLVLAEVDVETGRVRVPKVVAAHDVGRAVNPSNVEGQIQGGVAMGLGFALTEQFIHGITLSLADYHIPTSMDMPAITAILVEDQEPSGPFGAKGVGEPALIPTAPAILNAISDALGVRICSLPAHTERVREAVLTASGV
ncbi:MAG: xanthine dehydrogenase family protein molybdopterin-binding subunit [Desulfobacteraceae bacterium]